MTSRLSKIYFTKRILFLLSAIIFIILTTMIILASQAVYLGAYLPILIISVVIGYGTVFLIALLGIKTDKLVKKPKLLNLTAFLSIILLFLIISMSYIQVVEFLDTSPLSFNPRQYPIDVDSDYKFNTQYGDLNSTLEEILYWPSGPATDQIGEAYSWGESYILRLFSHLYNLTKETEYLYKTIDRLDVVANNSDYNKDGIPGYGSIISGYFYQEDPVTDGMVLLPFIELANMVKNGDNQSQYYELKPKFDYYASISEKVINKWNEINWVETVNETTGNISGSYLSPPENIQKIFNRNNALGRLMIELYHYTNNTSYRIIAEKIAQFFKDNLKIHTYSFKWDNTPREMYYWPYSVVVESASDFAKIVNNSTFSDVSHASIDISFVDMCYRSGIVFDEIDMSRFANTFIDFVYQGRVNQTGLIRDGKTYALNFADNVNGGYSGNYYYTQVRSGWFKIAKYYYNQTKAAFVIFTALQDLIETNNFNALITSLTIVIIIENIYSNNDFPNQFY